MRRLMGAFFVLGLLATVLAGCGGGGGDDGDIVSPAVQEGVFVDSPVEGVNYQTDTRSGVTDSDGRFHFVEGETVSFSIGDVMLGHAMGREIITPLDLVDGAEDVTHPTVTNMIRFMQSLDVDGDPDNGITITHQMRNEAGGRRIEFHMGIEEFENHSGVIGLLDTLSMMNAFRHGAQEHLVPAEQAREHMREHLDGGMPGGPVGGMPGGSGGEMPNNDGFNPPAGDDDDGGGFPMMTGIFIDSPVEGLHYETATQSGVTDPDGTFYFMDGETVSFSIGEVMLGHALGRETITPIDLVDGAEGVTHPTVTNMIRFMQSLDVDGNPDNGITITPLMRNEAGGRGIGFHMNIEEFENHPGVMGLLDTLSMMNVFMHGEQEHLVPIEQARAHMREHMGDGFIDDMPMFDDDGDHEGPMTGEDGMPPLFPDSDEDVNPESPGSDFSSEFSGPNTGHDEAFRGAGGGMRN